MRLLHTADWHVGKQIRGRSRASEHREILAEITGLATTRALARERIAWVEGTHLFPMEKPAETAAAVLQLLA